MGGGAGELTGPNLEEGIELGAIPDGGTLVGHAAGESVLLVRRGDEVFAVGATCTHYGAPLSDGIVVGETVRCPWHHACFDLRSGEAVGAPALNDLPCYEIARRDDRLVVIGKKSKYPAQRDTGTLRRIVVVGAGAAGAAAVETLRREGFEGSIVLVGKQSSVPVDLPNLSKDYLAGNAPEEWIPLRSLTFYAEQRVELALNETVSWIDRERKQIHLRGGRVLPYDALLLAPGAEPIRLDVPGAELPHVETLRTFDDCRSILARIPSTKHAVVVGAGFLGLEVAASLRARDIEVTVVAPEATPFERILGADLGGTIRALHEEHGVRFQLGRTVRAIGENDVTLDDGSVLPAELVFVGIGVRPSTELAEKAGLSVDRGILVDAHLRTSDPSIFAAGDAVRVPDARGGSVRIEHWVVAQRQGQHAARNILGPATPYQAVPFFWSQHYDVPIAVVGHAERWDRIDIDGDLTAHDVAIAYRRGSETLAVATIHRDRVSLLAEVALEKGDEAALRALVPPR